jgi:hypothetical protein
VTNVFALLRLLPMSDHGKDIEILALRHQIGVLECQLDGRRGRFDAGDRVFLAALFQGLPPEVLRRMRLLVRPDTVLRRHRGMVARGHAARSRPKRGGRPRTVRSIRALVLRPAGFFETVTLSGARLYVFALIKHTGRRIRILGVTAHPTTS